MCQFQLKDPPPMILCGAHKATFIFSERHTGIDYFSCRFSFDAQLIMVDNKYAFLGSICSMCPHRLLYPFRTMKVFI